MYCIICDLCTLNNKWWPRPSFPVDQTGQRAGVCPSCEARVPPRVPRHEKDDVLRVDIKFSALAQRLLETILRDEYARCIRRSLEGFYYHYLEMGEIRYSTVATYVREAMKTLINVKINLKRIATERMTRSTGARLKKCAQLLDTYGYRCRPLELDLQSLQPAQLLQVHAAAMRRVNEVLDRYAEIWDEFELGEKSHSFPKSHEAAPPLFLA